MCFCETAAVSDSGDENRPQRRKPRYSQEQLGVALEKAEVAGDAVGAAKIGKLLHKAQESEAAAETDQMPESVGGEDAAMPNLFELPRLGFQWWKGEEKLAEQHGIFGEFLCTTLPAATSSCKLQATND